VTPVTSSQVPNSPPPSFRSRASSPTRQTLLSHDPLATENDQALHDAFDNPSDDDASDAEEEDDDRQVLMRGTNRAVESETEAANAPQRGGLVRANTELPTFPLTTPGTVRRVMGGGSQGHDGVFANLNAKPERGEKVEEMPPVSHIDIF
jgi:Protein of unknown function (DUF2370)